MGDNWKKNLMPSVYKIHIIKIYFLERKLNTELNAMIDVLITLKIMM